MGGVVREAGASRERVGRKPYRVWTLARGRAHTRAMRPHRASFTAAFVATCRGLSPLLPKNVRLVDDPLGARVAGHAFAAVVDGLAQSPGLLRALAWVPLAPLFPWAVYMQVRTKALDDALLGFVAAGGRQVVILGAGFDARASRLREALGGAMVYEVDHPATQAKKRALFGEVPTTARYVAWDFERDAMTALPARLAAEGLDPAAPTFTLWEGVTMYLSAEAIAATLDAVRAYSAEGSQLAFNYVARREGGAGAAVALVGAVTSLVGEPFRSSFDPSGLAALLAAHGFSVLRDEGFDALAGSLLGPPYPAIVRGGRRIALVERTATAGV